MLMANDDTVRFYKGLGRPLLTYSERVELITACQYIDEVHKLEKLPARSNQFDLIKKIAPHFYFEGADSTDNDIQRYLDKLGIERVTLNTPQLHVSEILRRYQYEISRQYDHVHHDLINVAGL